MRDNETDATLQATLRDALHAELAQINPEAGLAQLHARLQADTAHTPVTRPAPWLDALRGWFFQWPTALASLIIVLQAGLLAWQAQPRPADDQAGWRSMGMAGAYPPPMSILAVRFAPQTNVQTMGVLLVQLQAAVVAGPDADGIWYLSVPTTQHKAALSTLRAAPSVLDAMAR